MKNSNFSDANTNFLNFKMTSTLKKTKWRSNDTSSTKNGDMWHMQLTTLKTTNSKIKMRSSSAKHRTPYSNICLWTFKQQCEKMQSNKTIPFSLVSISIFVVYKVIIYIYLTSLFFVLHVPSLHQLIFFNVVTIMTF